MAALPAHLRRLRSPTAVDVAIAAAVLAAGVAGLWIAPEPDYGIRRPDLLAFVLVALQGVPLVWRRREPVLVLWVVGVASVVQTALVYGTGGFGWFVALYTLAAYRRRGTAIPHLALNAVVVTGATVLAQARFAQSITTPFWDFVFQMLLAGIICVAGDRVRSHRAHTARLAADAAEAKRGRERAVAEERARIARELHDVVAHHVSVMVVQAGAARRVLGPQEREAREALGSIETMGRGALGEMRRLLGLLREGDVTTAGVAPQPTVEHLDALLDRVRDAGLDVALRVEGDPRELPPGVELSAYRIVQEALTNTLKHSGSSRAEVVLRYAPEELCVEVCDEGGPLSLTHRDGAGHGIIGMEERAAVVGGALRAEPRSGGGFVVRARLPLASRVT